MDELAGDEVKEAEKCLSNIISIIENEQTNTIDQVKVEKVNSDTFTNHHRDCSLFDSAEEMDSSELILELDQYLKHIEDLSYDYQLDQGLFMSNLKCEACKSQQSIFWRRVTRDKIVCNACFFEKAYLMIFDDEHLMREKNSNKEPNQLDQAENSNSTITNSNTIQTVNSKKKAMIKNLKGNSRNNRPLTRTTRKVQNEPASINENSSNCTPNSIGNAPALQTQLSTSSNTSASSAPTPNVAPKTPELNDESNALTRKSARILKAKQDESVSASTSVLSTLESSSLGNLKPEEVVVRSSNAGTNRRSKLFKKKNTPVRCETSVSRFCDSDYAFHRGFYITVGDIVALTDQIDKSNIYFAQIRAFMVDEYGEKSAILTWLVPKSLERKSIKTLQDFDWSLFELGPAEEYPRPLDCLDFVYRLSESEVVKALCANRKQDNHGSSFTKYQNSLLNHRHLVAELGSFESAAGNMKLITNRYFNASSKEDIIERDYIHCK
jgi:hypothetical protein